MNVRDARVDRYLCGSNLPVGYNVVALAHTLSGKLPADLVQTEPRRTYLSAPTIVLVLGML